MVKQGIIVKAVVSDEQGRMLLVRRSKTAPRRPLEWDLPGGFVDENDGSYPEACLRELAEETGVKKTKGAARLAYAESDFEKGEFDMTWLYFTVQAANTEVHLSYEHDDFSWVPLERAAQLIKYERQLRALKHIQRIKEATEESYDE